MQPFAEMLAGGPSNTLGRTLEVVDAVLADPSRLEELYRCFLADGLVGMRAGNGLRRVFNQRPDRFPAYADRLIDEAAAVDRSSARWTVAQLFLEHDDALNEAQRIRARDAVIRNLHADDDWIAVNMSMKTLEKWVKSDPAIRPRVVARVRQLADDRRRSVSKGALKLLDAMGEPAL